MLVQLATAVGLDPSVRLHPGGDAVRDAAQLGLLHRLRTRLHPALRWRTEVPLPIAGDRRAWDAVIYGDGWTVGVEAETRLRDVQAVLRRTSLKARDGALDDVILLIAGTRGNRAAVKASPDAFGAFDASQTAALIALGEGRRPGSAVVIL